jgi:glutamate--cysteine ligase
MEEEQATMWTQDASPFFDFRWGVERETHRIQSNGQLSAERHPEVLEAPAYTLDFAETQLEIVTTPAASISGLLSELGKLTAHAQQAIKPELLWPLSMPPSLPDDSKIAVAQLDHVATLYRQGLALRYGMARQMICGLHLNVSFGGRMTHWLSQHAPLATDEQSYELRLTRNLYQDLPHYVLLFSASPVRADSETLAFSHRSGPSGYAGAAFLPYLDLGSIEAYVEGIRRGIRTESATFAALGVVDRGQLIQLNANVFQSEKEFYAPIRIRQAALPGETSLQALSRRGAEYLELRFFDVDPFVVEGISEDTLRLMHLILLDALARPSLSPNHDSLQATLREAADASVIDPLHGLQNERFDRLGRRLSELEPWAQRLDLVEHMGGYSRVLRSFRDRAANPRLLASPTLARLFRDSARDWTHFGIDTALLHREGINDALAYARV